jgi:hypothetical protein
MEQQIPKAVKKELAAIATAAHEVALRRELEALAGHFDRWRRNEIDSFTLADEIHKFHDGPNRDIYKRFTYQGTSGLPVIAAYAVANGLVDKSSVSAETMPYIAPLVNFWRDESS